MGKRAEVLSEDEEQLNKCNNLVNQIKEEEPDYNGCILRRSVHDLDQSEDYEGRKVNKKREKLKNIKYMK